MLVQNGKPPVYEFHVHPVNQQRSLPQLNERTESPLPRAPAAPRVARGQNRHQHAQPDQKKRGAGVPEIVDRINMPRSRIDPPRRLHQRNPTGPNRKKDARLAPADPRTLQHESHSQPGESERAPGKNRKQPRLRRAQIVHPVDIWSTRYARTVPGTLPLSTDPSAQVPVTTRAEAAV